MRKPWTVVYTEHCLLEGMSSEGRWGTDWPKVLGDSKHVTYLGADFHRRFRHRYLTLPGSGSFWLTTQIDHDGWPQPQRRIEAWEKVLGPVWKVCYFARSRWDGLRHGLDRDRR